ncbi:MAG: hypothetical protein A2V90_00970 [Gammaproteobacteria bacterium RBG_16_57_12]|nr:MAG: hypothetical protein A2V90_00970 [Gammaproteobacteria bacterium RBG_16_57_12]
MLPLPVSSTETALNPAAQPPGAEAGEFSQILSAEQSSLTGGKADEAPVGKGLPSSGQSMPPQAAAVPDPLSYLSLLGIGEAPVAGQPADLVTDMPGGDEVISPWPEAVPRETALSLVVQSNMNMSAELSQHVAEAQSDVDEARLTAVPVANLPAMLSALVSSETGDAAPDIDSPVITPYATGNRNAAMTVLALQAELHPAQDTVVDPEFQALLSQDDGVPLTAHRQDGLGSSQPAALTDSRATTAVVTLPQTLQHPRWGEAFGERLVWMVKQDVQVAELQLNPPRLGPLEIRISLNHDQASITFASQHAPVRDAVEAALPRLREMLADAGVTLQGANISHQSFSQQQGAQHPQGNSSGLTAGEEDYALDGQSLSEMTVTRLHNGMIDLYA